MFVPRKRKWSDLSGEQRLAIMIMGVVEVVMLVAAFVNFFGPLAYFIFGRKRG